MGYGIRDGDIISLTNEKAGALTLSRDLYDYREDKLDPAGLWQTQPAIRSVVDFVTTSISSVPFQLYNRRGDGGRLRNYTHPVAQALETPGYKLGGRRFVQRLMHDYMLNDRWFFTLNPVDGGLWEFVRLPADRCAIAVDAQGRYSDLAVLTDEGWKLRPLDDVVFDVGVDVEGGKMRKGHSALRTLSDLAAELQGMSEYRANLFRNSAMVPAVIERPVEAPKWTDDAWKRFKAEFSTYRAGGGNAGGTPLLEDGMKLKPIDVFNPRDSQYIEVRQLALIEAAQALRIPPELVGAKEGTHSNIVALREQLYVDVLGPEIGYFEDALNVGLKHVMQRNQYIEANLEVRLRGSMAERAKIYQAAGGRPWLTVNEIRAMENKPAIDGGDELITPLNVATGAQANPQDTAPDDNGQDEKDTTLPKARPAAAGTLKAADPAKKWAKADRRANLMVERVAKWWKGYAATIADLLGVDLDPDAPKARTKALPVIPRDEMIEEAEVLAQILLSEMQDLAQAGADVVIFEFNPDAEGFDPGRQLAWLEKAATQSALRLDKQMLDEIAKAMQSPDTWEEGIRRTLSNDADVRKWATGLATESASFGSYDAAKAFGITEKTWIVTSSNPRESHRRQAGTWVGIEDEFPNGARYPGDWYAGPEEVLNCQCRIDYRTKE